MRYVGAGDGGTTTVARRSGLPGWPESPALAERSGDPLQKPSADGVRRARFARYGFYVPVSVGFTPVDEAITGKPTAKDALGAIHRRPPPWTPSTRPSSRPRRPAER